MLLLFVHPNVRTNTVTVWYAVARVLLNPAQHCRYRQLCGMQCCIACMLFPSITTTHTNNIT
jgi:hypothetical protein